MREGKKVLVIGLDSAPPELLFNDFKGEMPNIQGLMDNGIHGELESCDPPITVPAWMVMSTSKSPGALGLYGFRHRKNFSYTEGWLANSSHVSHSTVWDILGKEGMPSCLVGVPPSYPPKPINGSLVSCFLTPNAEKAYTYPAELKGEIQQLVGEYLFDITFRTNDRDKLLLDLYSMTEKRFKVLKHLMTTKPWNFFMFVEIGVDRLHHTFWKFYDKTHPKYESGNKYEHVIREYYKFLDTKIGELISLLDEDTTVMVVSDHGTKGMKGAFCINEWLAQEGYLVLKEKPGEKTDIEKANVDWSKTKAWGWGGYYARIFLNVRGREASGTVDPSEYEGSRDEIAARISEIRDPNGRRMDTKVLKPENIYSQCVGDKPDLMVYLDDLDWRSAGTLGHGTMYLSENDTGPDDSVHSKRGVFIISGQNKTLSKGGMKGAKIYDIAPTILSLMGSPVPREMEGSVMDGVL